MTLAADWLYLIAAGMFVFGVVFVFHVDWWGGRGPVSSTPISSFIHMLGFHGPNWQPFWLRGDVWIECVICGKRRLPPPEDFAGVPDNQIAPCSRFG